MIVAQLYSSYELYNKPSPQDYLAHHGIRGQKWGKRNGPPYPLDAEDHSAAEKKAGWRKSLDKEQKKPDNRSKSTGGDSPKIAVQQKSKSDKLLKKDLTDKQKQFARNVVIGASITAAVLATTYVGYKIADNKSSKKILRFSSRPIDLKGMELSRKLSELPISELSDDDIFIKKGTTTFQRIVGSTSKASALLQEKSSDVMYTTYTATDNDFYKSVFAQIFQKKGTGMKQFVSSMTNVNDLVMPSERKRVSVFTDLIKENPDFKKAFESELSKLSKVNVTIGEEDSQRYYKDFMSMFGNKDGTSRNIYIKKLMEMGYNALVDDNDANRVGQIPVITLNAQNDMVINGMKTLGKLDQIISGLRLKDFDFDKWKAFSSAFGEHW